MFQYAAGRALSLRHNTGLSLDTSGFENYALHQGFELSTIFDINQPCLDGIRVADLLSWRRHRAARKIFRYMPGCSFNQPLIVQEPHFHYWPGWESLPSSVYLDGYWQSARYFIEHEQKIREDFQFKQSLDTESRHTADIIKLNNSVSLHIRRGDYASNQQTTAVHGLCPPAYYENAIRHIGEQFEDVLFFIFSDDIEWVRANIPLAKHRHVYVDHNKAKNSWRDMKLMSLCDHHVIANSSFSWWAAWLNPSEDKIVIAPRQWFAKSKDTSHLIPSQWIRL